MSKFVVSGATGYVGTHLVRQLLETGNEVTVLSRKDPVSVAKLFAGYNLQITKFDLASQNFDKLHNLNLSSSILVDLAWDFDSNDHMRQVEEHLRFTSEMVKLGVRKVAVAGTLQELDFNQGQVDEDSPRSGKESHGAAKTELFFRLSESLAAQGVPLVWMRLHYIMGDDIGSRSIFGRILANPEPFPLNPRQGKFDFIHVRALAEQMAKVLAGNSTGTLDFGSGERLTFREVLFKWLIENGKAPSLYLTELDIASENTEIGTWPDLMRLKRYLGDASCSPSKVKFQDILEREANSNGRSS